MGSSAYERVKAWRKTHPEARMEEARRYRKRHPDKVAANSRRYRERHPEEVRMKDRMAMAAYRKTERYRRAQAVRNRRFKAKLLKLQEQIAGRPRPDTCELCGRHGGGPYQGRTVFDHDHKTGKFRGWLCHWCNRTLGMVKDDPAMLLKMADYLVQGGLNVQDYLCTTEEAAPKLLCSEEKGASR